MKKELHVSLSCSFCGKAQRDVRKLVAGPTVYICDGCVALSAGMIDEQRLESAQGNLSKLAHLVREAETQLLWNGAPQELWERARALALGIEAAAADEEV